ncbi:MAG: hypothetical protein QW594_00020 [Candidatus Woesearchaeota archaeon]
MDSFQTLPVTMRLGKQGLSIGVLQELKGQLKRRGIIKIRMLKTYPFQADRKSEAIRIAQVADADLVGIVGYFIVLKKKDKNQHQGPTRQEKQNNEEQKRE